MANRWQKRPFIDVLRETKAPNPVVLHASKILGLHAEQARKHRSQKPQQSSENDAIRSKSKVSSHQGHLWCIIYMFCQPLGQLNSKNSPLIDIPLVWDQVTAYSWCGFTVSWSKCRQVCVCWRIHHHQRWSSNGLWRERLHTDSNFQIVGQKACFYSLSDRLCRDSGGSNFCWQDFHSLVFGKCDWKQSD